MQTAATSWIRTDCMSSTIWRKAFAVWHLLANAVGCLSSMPVCMSSNFFLACWTKWKHLSSKLFWANQYRPILTQYHQLPTSTALYWPSATQYQSVPPFTDPVPPNTNQYRPLLTQYHQLPTSTALYWPSNIKYQPVPPFTDPVPSSTNQYCPILSQYYWPSNTKYQLVSAHVDPYLKTIFGDLEWFGDVLG